MPDWTGVVTRPRGTVIISLSRHRSIGFSSFLKTFQPSPRSLLGTAGWSESEIEATTLRERQAITDLVWALADKPRGRRRSIVSDYKLPMAGLRLIDNGYAAHQMPWRLRAVVRSALRLTKKRKGPNLSPDHRLKNMKNGSYAPETMRRYQYEDRQRSEGHRQLSEVEWPFSDGRDQNSDRSSATAHIRVILLAHRWLI